MKQAELPAFSDPPPELATGGATSAGAAPPNVRFDHSMPQPRAIARAILEGFDLHYRRFRFVAQQAKSRFERGDWLGMRDSARDRIDYYDQRVLDAVERIERGFDLDCLSDAERDEGFHCFDTEDFATGYRAFLAKQKPEFEGR